MSKEKIPSSPPLFSHKRWSHRRGYQKCVKFVGIDRNYETFGKGFPLCVAIEFKKPIFRYTPRSYEIARLLASFLILYGEEYMDELFALTLIEYNKMRRRKVWLTHFGDGSD